MFEGACQRLICMDAIQRDADAFLGVGAIIFALACVLGLVALAIFYWLRWLEQNGPRGNAAYVKRHLKIAGGVLLLALVVAWWAMSWHNWHEDSSRRALWLILSGCLTVGFGGYGLLFLIGAAQPIQKPLRIQTRGR
jgi:hypothetical protein